MLYKEKEKLWNKENKLFSWQTSRKVNSLLGGVETISPSSFPSGRRKNRGIPLWQHHKEITRSLLSHWSTKRFPFTTPLWKHWWLMCHFSQRCSFQVQSITSATLKPKWICVFPSRSVLFQFPHAAWWPNWETQLAASQRITCLFLPWTAIKQNFWGVSSVYFWKIPNSNPDTYHWVKPFSTTYVSSILQFNFSNSPGQGAAGMFPNCNLLSDSFLPLSLPYMCMLNSTQTAMKAFFILSSCYILPPYT